MFVEIYGRLSCPYCVRAKQLAEKMKAELPDFDFKFVDMIAEGVEKQDLEPRVGKPVATVPQIFLDEVHVGGYSDFAPLIEEKFGIKL
ncbi:GrxA family glutaredoxin [Glaesserella parasuis]|uniref:GrxA family glutaredoxin n=1 Tax=Glaesserella parasuis TaxID=738 RepID=UPI0003AC2E52|nr:GrxA family glutaredoxin [Glaesserella parasuis]EQA15417.1 glutaredoxin, GrxA family [Glaesserella parasuis 174]MCT8738355.1 GrxA family glutaredoxin [Glaesserella parasuis]MCT8742654.1 GrxA family glutaredoxin [Glaesserella parasuis]MCT8744750.1 GrxA family glutaredoxin [Glaesserella parasuis]MDD2171014.1 GrxA family glutaredoxin [Glaesserella parasuis]